MMTDKSTALAHWLERDGAACQQHLDAAAQLRRLQADNTWLIDVLREIVAGHAHEISDATVVEDARAALARATGEIPS